jgi:SAM-dependent methyltransferase
MTSGPPPASFPEAYRSLASVYDARSQVARRERREVVGRRRLQPGDVVIDVGCGTGLCFPAILDTIGPTGYLVGIDQSAEMLDRARARVKELGWDNVDLVCAPAEKAELSVRADAVLFCLTHDILRSRPALENVFSYLRPGARVAALGPKWAQLGEPWFAPWWGPAVNLLVVTVNRPYVRSFEGFDRPWSHLAELVPDLHIDSIFLGGAYRAWGTTAADVE